VSGIASGRGRLLALGLVAAGALFLAWWQARGGAFTSDVPPTAVLVPITPIVVDASAEVAATQPAAPPTRSAPPGDRPADPELRVVPERASPDSVVFIEGFGFGPDEVVDIAVIGPVGRATVRAGTDGTGAFQLPHRVEPDGPLGLYRVEAVGRTSGRRAEVTFTVADVPTPTPIVIQIETTLATATPEGMATPVAVPLYQVVNTLGGVDCAWFGFFGYVYNPDGSPRPGVAIRLFHRAPDGTFVGGTTTTNAEGYWEVFLGREIGADIVGVWHLVVMEGEQRGSAEIALDVPADCRSGRPTKFQIDWQRSVP